MTREQKQLYEYIGAVSFAAVDIMEYLDTHPCDAEAINYHNHLIRLLNKAKEDYARLYGPLTVSTTDSCSTRWDWALQAPPWKGEC